MSTTVRRAPDPALRLRMQRMLSAASLEPAGVPPSAILVVRSLGDPLPGRVRAGRLEARPPADWERAVRAALGERYRQAARPVRGVLPEFASAVLFADQAEMMAAFARDARAGVAGARWWWAALLRAHGGNAAALLRLWLREPRHVPAAVEHLAAWGEAERVMAWLEPAQAARLLAAVAHAFAIPELLAAPSSPVREMEIGRSAESPRAASPPDATRSPSARGDADLGESPVISPPWEMVIGRDAVPRALAPEQQALLGVALTLHRAPLAARGRGFVARFARWRAEATVARRAEETRPQPSISLHRPPSPALVAEDGQAPVAIDPSISQIESVQDLPRGRAPLAPAPEVRTDRGMEMEGDGDRTSPRPPISTADAKPSVAGDGDRGDEPDGRIARIESPPSGDHPRSGGEARTEPLLWFASPPIEVAEVVSGACGVFYLVNAVRAMGFFRALDEHFRLPPVVGAWGWIELLARSLLTARAAGLRDDAVWRVLAGLDGREPDQPPGAGFISPEVESLPDDWAALVRGRTPGTAPLGTGHLALGTSEPPLGIEPPSALRRFLDLVVPVFRLRLESALRAGGAGEALETAMFRRVGLVRVTRAHVDVHMELDQVSLPVRLAGLDANPGWVPELARVISFHFA